MTPQRLAVFKAVRMHHNHPTADQLIGQVKKMHPGIATGTVYKILDILEEKRLVKKVKTEAGVMRYDAVTEQHHHLYCPETGQLHDYFDPELNTLLREYFKKTKISGFRMEDVQVHVSGKFFKDSS